MSDNSYKINRGITLTPQSSVPSNPINGDIYYDFTMGTYSFYQNGFWINLSSKSDVASATDLTSTQFTAAVVQNSLVRITGTTTTNVHGLTASTSAKQVLLYNQTNTSVLIKNASGTEGTAANRIVTATGGDITLSSGQTIVLVYDTGQSRWITASSPSTGTGSGTGSDLTSLQYRGEFIDGFDENPSATTCAVDTGAGKTDSNAYSASKTLYQLSYDASKTIAAATTTTTINLSADAAFTVKTGDMVIYGSQARRITAVGSQSSFTVEAFDVAPTLAGQVTVSQAVHTKDVYGFAVDGVSLSAGFAGASFSEILVDYEDTTTVGDNIYDVNTAPVIAYDASHDGSSWTNWAVRATNETDTWQSLMLNASGTALYLRFFANKTSGSGSVNVLRYVTKLQKSTAASTGGVTWSAYGTTDNSTTPVNCTISVMGGKTTITLTGGLTYALGVNPTTTYGSLDVLVNGQLLPRFLSGTTPPTDGYFTEVSPTVIQLDTDYSSLQLDVQVIQRTANLPIDTTTSNTTNISAINTHLFRNYIINGNFDFWQRLTFGSTSFSSPAVNAYTADRSQISYDGTSGTFTISRQAFTLGQTDVPNEPTYFLRWNQTVAGSGDTYRLLQHNIESVRTLAGKTFTLSFYAKADTTRTVTPAYTQYFGSGGGASSPYFEIGSGLNLTTAWQKFEVTFTLASIAGKTIGTDGMDCLQILLLVPNNSTFTIDFAQIMVNEGGTAAPWVYASGGSHLNPEAELALCQRYYWKTDVTNGGVVTAVGYFDSTTLARYSIKHPTTMRAAPTVSISAAADAVIQRPGTSAASGSSVSSLVATVHAIFASIVSGSASTTGFGTGLSFQNNGYIQADAEL